ncbi:hypothetical protein Taro_034067 [Colocasia esculenta]|uniref:Uncharacterized protein n=1 Tax=Colocasia esculenta TaxID=4460 RepID=A0A843VVH6_COLES|nr:hypothetical protein [Colocasia esculenta]
MLGCYKLAGALDPLVPAYGSAATTTVEAAQTMELALRVSEVSADEVPASTSATEVAATVSRVEKTAMVFFE